VTDTRSARKPSSCCGKPRSHFGGTPTETAATALTYPTMMARVNEFSGEAAEIWCQEFLLDIQDAKKRMESFLPKGGPLSDAPPSFKRNKAA
jgi:hypothetical protein